MLKTHKASLEDLNQLLKVDPKNTAAKKEMDLVKALWREVDTTYSRHKLKIYQIKIPLRKGKRLMKKLSD